MTKEEKIKEAYGEYWEQLKPFIDCEGWMHRIDFPTKHNIEIEEHSNQYHIRPKSLQGIEDNNGWIKIESRDDFPNFSDDVFYNLHDIDNNETVYYKTYDDLEFMWKKGIITHYKQIIEEKPPIY